MPSANLRSQDAPASFSRVFSINAVETGFVHPRSILVPVHLWCSQAYGPSIDHHGALHRPKVPCLQCSRGVSKSNMRGASWKRLITVYLKPLQSAGSSCRKWWGTRRGLAAHFRYDTCLPAVTSQAAHWILGRSAGREVSVVLSDLAFRTTFQVLSSKQCSRSL